MSIRDIKEKLMGITIPKEVKKEDFELTDSEKKIMEDKHMDNEPKIISDEVEDMNASAPLEAEEIKIKTVFVKEEDKESYSKRKLMNAAKIAAGVGVAAVGIAALLLGMKKKR
jgi:hypothetical protein